MIRMLLLLGTLIPSAAFAVPAAVQVQPPVDPMAIVNQAVSQAVAATVAAMPQPGNVVGAGEVVGGAVGTSTAYKRADWVPPRRSRTGNCTLSAAGTCSITWTSPFNSGETPVMFGEPVAVNLAAIQPIDCDVTTAPTVTGVTVKCWQAQPTILGASLLSIANLAINPFAASTLSGVSVSASAIPASQ